jgi:hypothetical protein
MRHGDTEVVVGLVGTDAAPDDRTLGEEDLGVLGGPVREPGQHRGRRAVAEPPHSPD